MSFVDDKKNDCVCENHWYYGFGFGIEYHYEGNIDSNRKLGEIIAALVLTF